ncbi:hypothetical protein ACWGLP_21325 [Streptomyces lydicus]|uniref:hypothetical protein n=1 Tax=Streptomyces lydicus TaxID=47763 RepID=UPI0037D594F3
MSDPKTPAVDTRSDTPGVIVTRHAGYVFFQPDWGGPEMQIADHWISTRPAVVRNARAAQAARQER